MSLLAPFIQGEYCVVLGEYCDSSNTTYWSILQVRLLMLMCPHWAIRQSLCFIYFDSLYSIYLSVLSGLNNSQSSCLHLSVASFGNLFSKQQQSNSKLQFLMLNAKQEGNGSHFYSLFDLARDQNHNLLASERTLHHKATELFFFSSFYLFATMTIGWSWICPYRKLSL